MRRGDSIACDYKMTSDEQFPEYAAGNVDQIQHAGNSRINQGGRVFLSMCH